MKIGTYENTVLFDKNPVIKLNDFYKNDKIRQKLERGVQILHPGEREYKGESSLNIWEIDIDDSSIKSYNGLKFPIACGRSGETPRGEFIVAEKWINPYWIRTSTEEIYLPSKQNPIGKYLIILADMWKNEKLKTSIHAWPGEPVNHHDFQCGTPTTGCISLKREDMEKLFFKMQPGDRVDI